MIAYGCLIRRKLVGRLWSIYIQGELLSKHAKLICDTFPFLETLYISFFSSPKCVENNIDTKGKKGSQKAKVKGKKNISKKERGRNSFYSSLQKQLV